MSAAGTVRNYFNALTQGDLDGAVAMVADDVDFRTPMGPLSGREQIRGYLAVFDAAFPGAAYELDVVIDDGRVVAAEGTYRGTHHGPLPLPDGKLAEPTGRPVTAPFVTMFEVADGLIRSHRPYWDLAGLLAQITA